HPKRAESDYGPHLDRFAALVIYLSIAALEVDPELWNQYHTGDNLLFVRDDYRDRNASGLWQSLAELGSPEIDRLADALAGCLERRPADVPDLESVLRKSKPSKRGSPRVVRAKVAPSGLPAWLANGAPAALPVLDLAKHWQLVWSRPRERTELRWKRTPEVA